MPKYIFLLIMFYIFSFSSCTDENEFKQNNSLPEAPEGKVNIEFDLNSGAFLKPETKNIRSDANFDAPWVLSFKLENQDSPNPDTLFVEAVKTEIEGSKYFMQLSGSKEPHLLYFVANADKVIENKKSLFPTKKFGQVMSLLTFGNPSPDANFGLGPLSNPQGSVPFTNQNIPMTATAQLDQIVKGTKVIGTVNLQRIVSKIYLDATKANKKDGFVLTGLTVIDVPSRGYMNNKIDIRSVQPQDIIDYGRKTGADRLTTLVLENIEGNTTLSSSTDRPIYVYPFLENDSRGGVYQVIFSGHFGDNTTKYFKIKLGGLNNPAALNKPNTSFLINIESIANNGYVSLEHALQYDESTGVVVKVTLLDNAHDIIANGKYYMGLSNSEYLLCDDGSRLDIVLSILTFDKAPASNIDLSKVTKRITTQGLGLIVPNPQWIPGSPIEIKATLLDNFTSGIIKIQIGDLTKEITVTRLLADAYQSVYIFPDLSLVDVEWETNENNYTISENRLGALTLQIPENILPERWIIRDTETLEEMISNSEEFAAEPIFRAKYGKGRVFDKNGLKGTTIVDIRQAMPQYLGWFGGAGDRYDSEMNGYSYPNRLLMHSAVDKYEKYSNNFNVTGLTSKSDGETNTQGLYNLSANAETYPAAWRCWMMNDYNGDGIVTPDEVDSNPWYLPAQKQLQAISITYQTSSYYSLWCSTELSGQTGFIVNMKGGRGDYYGKNYGFQTRCVKNM